MVDISLLVEWKILSLNKILFLTGCDIPLTLGNHSTFHSRLVVIAKCLVAWLFSICIELVALIHSMGIKLSPWTIHLVVINNFSVSRRFDPYCILWTKLLLLWIYVIISSVDWSWMWWHWSKITHFALCNIHIRFVKHCSCILIRRRRRWENLIFPIVLVVSFKLQLFFACW